MYREINHCAYGENFKKNWKLDMSCMVFIDLYWSMQSRRLFYPLHIKLTIHGNITTLIKKTHQVFLCNTCKQYMTSLQFLMKNSALLQHFFKKGGGGVPKNLDTQKKQRGGSETNIVTFSNLNSLYRIVVLLECTYLR